MIPCPKCGQPLSEGRACPGFRPFLMCVPAPGRETSVRLALRDAVGLVVVGALIIAGTLVLGFAVKACVNFASLPFGGAR